jgi:glycosyltransferase involved in cell wall biosynthesis
MKSVLIVTPCAPGSLPKQSALIAAHLRDDGVRVGQLTTAKSPLGRFCDVCFHSFWSTSRHHAVLVDVFGERAFAYETVAILCARFWRRRALVVLRNGMLPDFVARWPRWTKTVLSMAELVVTPHSFLRERLTEAGIRVDGIIPNFVDLESYEFRRRMSVRPRFLYLRGMYPIYNPEMALRAFAIVQRKYPDASITMAGRDGPELPRCQDLVNALGLRHVRFMGLVPKNQISALADEHDIHLHTNRLENMPVTIIEMWACGLPIVGTNVGGMSYLVRDGVDAILVPSNDHEAMAAACLAVLSNNRLAERLSDAGRSRAESLAWTRVKPLWEQALFSDVRAWSPPDEGVLPPAAPLLSGARRPATAVLHRS